MMKYMKTTSIFMRNRSVSYPFGSSSSSHNNEHVEDIPIETKHNPTGIKDLRGHQILKNLEPLQKSYSPLHNPEISSVFSLHRISSSFSNSTARSLGRLVANPKSTLASQNLHLPMINPGAIPVYDGLNIGAGYTIANQLFTSIVPLSSMIFQHQPFLSVLSISALYYVYYKLRWQVGKDIVIKMQLLPHTEQLSYQKISYFGKLYTKRVNINDLEHTTFDQIFGQNDPTEKSSRGMVNLQIAFRNKHTGELFYFGRDALWHQQGVNHPLLI